MCAHARPTERQAQPRLGFRKERSPCPKNCVRGLPAVEHVARAERRAQRATRAGLAASGRRTRALRRHCDRFQVEAADTRRERAVDGQTPRTEE